MTHPLRRMHFFAWLIIAALLPILVIAALIARQDTMPLNPNFTMGDLR